MLAPMNVPPPVSPEAKGEPIVKQNMKKFHCMPTVVVCPIIFFAASLLYVYFLLNPDINFVNAAGEPDPLGGKLVVGGGLLLGLVLAFTSLHTALRRVELTDDRVICRGMFPWETFEIPYEGCSVGFDYHIAGGGRFWWIYICEGAPPKYPANDKRNRISKEKIRPGFIKLTYSEEAFQALAQVLPRKQRDYLVSSRRFKAID